MTINDVAENELEKISYAYDKAVNIVTNTVSNVVKIHKNAVTNLIYGSQNLARKAGEVAGTTIKSKVNQLTNVATNLIKNAGINLLNKAGSGATSLLGGNNFMKNLSQSFLDTILKVCSPDSMRAKNESGGTVNKKALLKLESSKEETKESSEILRGEIIMESVEYPFYDFIETTRETYIAQDGIIMLIAEEGKGLTGVELNLPKINLFGTDWGMQWSYGIGNQLKDWKYYSQSTQSNSRTNSYWSVGSGFRADWDSMFALVETGLEENNAGTRYHAEITPLRGTASTVMALVAMLIPEEEVDPSTWTAGQVPTGE